MLKEKKRFLGLIIGFALMVCCVADVMGQQRYMELLEKRMSELAGYRNPFAGLMSRTGRHIGNLKFVPAPGLDKKDAVPFLINVLKNGPRESKRLSRGLYPRLARCYAALSLGTIGDSRALEPLVEATRTEDKEDQRAYVSHYAAVALGLLGDSLAIDPLMVTLEDKRLTVRIGAAGALSVLVKEEGAASGALRRVAETDTNIFVRVAAQRALGRIEARITKQKEPTEEENK